MAYPPGNTDETIVIDGSIVKNIPNGYFSYAVANLKNIIFTEGVEVIGYTAFKIGAGVTSVLEYVELPTTIKEIQGEAFVGNKNLRQVICKATIPPTLAPNQVFRESNGKDTRLGVPANLVDTYKASPWNTTISAGTNAFPVAQIVAYNTITVIDGTCIQSASTPNFAVKVIANEAPEGKAFSGWTTNPAATFVNPKASVGIFTMPASDITVRATFSEKRPYTIIDASTPSGEAGVGSVVNIDAEPIRNGQLFRNWEIVEGNGVVLDNPQAISTSFTMVDAQVTIAARYASAYMINITGGDAVLEAFENDIVSVSAATKSNQEFVNWTTTTPNVVFANPESPVTTFIMPANEVNVTANFKYVSALNENFAHIRLYPNPASNYIKVEGFENNQYEIVDVLGKSVLCRKINEGTIAIGNLKNGIYIFKSGGQAIRFIKK